MPVDKKKLWVLFLAFLMLGSIFAIVFLGGQNNPPTAPPQDPAEPEEPTGIPFEAQGVEAKVTRLFPLMVVTSRTTQTQISQLDLKIQQIPGVTGIANSRYASTSQDPSRPLDLVYFGEVSISETADASGIAKKIALITDFEAPEILRAGLVSLPPRVVFQNSDLNVIQEHSFQNPASNAYISPDTLKDDDIRVSLQARISASTLQSIIAFEETNVTALPEYISLDLTLPLIALDQNLQAVFSAGPSLVGNETVLEQELSALLQPQSVQVQTGFFIPSIEIFLNRDVNAFRPDLETALTDLNGVVDFSVVPDENKLVVYLQTDTFEETKQAVLLELESLGFPAQTVEDPVVPAGAKIVFSSTDLMQASEQAKQFLESKGYFGIKLSQGAFFENESFSDPDTNTVYDFSEKTFTADILPTHSQDDQVNLQATITIVRGKIVQVSAKEALEGEDQ